MVLSFKDVLAEIRLAPYTRQFSLVSGNNHTVLVNNILAYVSDMYRISSKFNYLRSYSYPFQLTSPQRGGRLKVALHLLWMLANCLKAHLFSAARNVLKRYWSTLEGTTGTSVFLRKLIFTRYTQRSSHVVIR